MLAPVWMQSSASWARACVGLEVVRVVGAARRGAPRARAIRMVPSVTADLLLEAVRLDLHEVVVLAEDVLVPAGGLEAPWPRPRRGAGALTSELRQPGEDEEPLGVLGQQLLVHPRLVVEALEVGLGDELDEVGVARLVADEHGDVVRALVAAVLARRSKRLPGAT